jgi:hypothetical protein
MEDLMPRRMTPSQLRSKIRQQQTKANQALRKLDREIKKMSRDAKRSVDEYNRKVRQHNSRVKSAARKLKGTTTQAHRSGSPNQAIRIRTTTRIVQRSFTQVETKSQRRSLSSREREFLQLAKREAENSALALDSLTEDRSDADGGLDELRQSEVAVTLGKFSSELENRWAGALFALHPENPDAARHFCTSAREVFVQFLNLHAPDELVFNEMPECAVTEDGRPTRRSRIELLLNKAGLPAADFTDFVDDDVDDILELFRAFNDGTHGSAGRFSMGQLLTLKRRSEQGLHFLARIVEPN